MNEGVLPHESKKFIRALLVISLLWFLLGVVVHANSEVQLVAFIQIFLFSFLDLIFLVLLFWTL